jgi:hypothetical protein
MALEGVSAVKHAFTLVKAIQDLLRHPNFEIGAIQAQLVELQERLLTAQHWF